MTTLTTLTALRARVRDLELAISRLGSAVVAFSGGVDSSVVAALAVRAIGDRALAVTAVSPSLATGELDGAIAVARAIGIAHETVTTDELASDAYRRNGADRCYHCKTELYEQLTSLASRRGIAAVLSGTNADDAGDWRPGLQAAAEHAVASPLRDAGVGKGEVREIARLLKVPSADKPASPCLSSRIPYGTAVDRETLARIDGAEQSLKALGYRELRVRHYGTVARVEIGEGELARALSPPDRGRIEDAVRSAGYETVKVATEPLRSGSLSVSFLGSPGLRAHPGRRPAR